MRTQGRSWASSFVAFDRHAPPSANEPPAFDDGRAFTPLHGDVAHFSDARHAPATQAQAVAREHDALPLDEFLKDVHREKCRAERSGAALSLALFEIGHQKGPDGRHADRLLELLHGAKRETDILGHAGYDTIAVLCPDTDSHGIQVFMRHIGAKAGDLPYAAVAATYPDNLFDNLARGSEAQQPLQLFLEAETLGQGSCGYPFKRCLDIAGALVAIGLFAPLMLIVAAAITLGSPGPIIFRQTRLGLGGVPFAFYKFRSMATNVDDRIHRAFVARLIEAGQCEGAEADAMPAAYKLQRDPRVTRLGRIMRKTSIDELPQLFNVLKGDMSLVGPRPAIPYEAAQYRSWHLRRMLTVKPGITGLWQVEGRSRVSFNEMVRMDLRYIRECSLVLDLRILLKTMLVVVLCKGAV